MIDIKLYEIFDEEEREIKKLLSSDVEAVFTSKTIQEEKDEAPPAKLISIRTQSIIPDAWAKTLKGIITRTQGYDYLVNYKKRTKSDVLCGYLGEYCSRAVAEHAILAMMFLLRKIKKQMENFNAFHRSNITGFECKCKKAFVLGVGNIGGEIVDIARGLKMKVKGFDIVERIKDLEYVSLEEGVKWADVVFCSLPLNEETEGMIDYNILQKAEKGTIFVNISRGEISPLEGLDRLLSEDKLAGISVDVYEQEQDLSAFLRGDKSIENNTLTLINKLKDRENVLFTPHNAFNSKESLERKAKLTVEAIRFFIQKNTFPMLIPEE